MQDDDPAGTIYEFAALTDEHARYWQSMDGWTAEEAAHMLCGISPIPALLDQWVRYSRAAGRLDWRSAVEYENYHRVRLALLLRAGKVAALTFPARPAAVIEWAIAEAVQLPAALVRDGCRVEGGKWSPAPTIALEAAPAREAPEQPAPVPARWIGGRRLWTLREAIAAVAALPGVGLSHQELTYRVQRDAEQGKLTMRDETGAPRASDVLAIALSWALFADDFNEWLRAAMFLEPFRLTDDSAAEGQSVDGKPAEPAPGAATTIGPARETAAGVIRHSTKTKSRDTLDPVIELAQSKCRDSKDTAQVWAQLQVLAQEEYPPFLGMFPEGLKYTKGAGDAHFNRGALDKRLHPEKREKRR